MYPINQHYYVPRPYPHYTPIEPIYYQKNLSSYWFQQNQPSYFNPYPTPYPKPVPFATPQQTSVKSVVNSFKKTDGNFDINKMMDTAGQVMGTMNQLNSLFKGVSQLFK
ncbi:YppG family protein [Bacillus sp. FJAT-47783]|uniref:YppG family protein n=1 Tax=Bacillus sp. FJAT-47783 TaxID=2922712 RepID=UPI001FAE24EA|nr:YppG family protein [Bacillus sp. FJAT-47783]